MIVGIVVILLLGCGGGLVYFVVSKVSSAVGEASEGFADITAQVKDAAAEAAKSRANAGGVPAEQGPAKAPALKSYACSGVMQCFVSNDHIGPIGLRVTSKVSSTGKIESVKLTGGTAPDPIFGCIDAHLTSLTLEEYPSGKTGTLKCALTGKLGPGVMEVSHSGAFDLDE